MYNDIMDKATNYVNNRTWDTVTKDDFCYLWGELECSDSVICGLFKLNCVDTVSRKRRFFGVTRKGLASGAVITETNPSVAEVKASSEYRLREKDKEIERLRAEIEKGKKIGLTAERMDELDGLVGLLAVNGVRNNTTLEDLHSHISDVEMRELMLSVERALRLTLYSYDTIPPEYRKDLLDRFYMQRSWDSPYYNQDSQTELANIAAMQKKTQTNQGAIVYMGFSAAYCTWLENLYGNNEDVV